MMEISQFVLARLYLLSGVLGVGLGVFYDLLRITRVFLGVQYSLRATKKLQAMHFPLLKERKKRTESPFLGTVIFFEDLLFGLLCGVSMVLLLYGANNGNFRFPTVICAGAGFFLYRGTVGKLVMLFSEVIAFFIEIFIRYICYFISFPFRWIGGKMAKLFYSGCMVSYQKIQKDSRKRYTKQENKRVDSNACGMIKQNGQNSKGSLKRGHCYGAKRTEAVQSEHSDESVPCGHRRGLFGRVCK